MPCYRPWSAIQRADGSVSMGLDPRKGDQRLLRLPCGKCIGCRLERSRQWTLRCLYESRLHDRNSFVTLTYDDDSLPRTDCDLDLPTLRYRDVQLFLKRLRKKHSVTFFCAGEYGGVTLRPHYHLLLFGVDFSDDRKPTVQRAGNQYFESDFLANLWPHGQSDISAVSPGSIAYTCQYVIDKQSTADYGSRTPPFCRMSLRPAIGKRFFDRFASDFRHGEAVANGRRQKLPRYFRNKLYELDPESVEDFEFAAYEFALGRDEADRSDERLRAGEEIALSRRNLLTTRSEL